MSFTDGWKTDISMMEDTAEVDDDADALAGFFNTTDSSKFDAFFSLLADELDDDVTNVV
jgi:hypothetical protein